MLNILLNKAKDQMSQVNLADLWQQHSSKVEHLVVDGLLGLTEDKLVNEAEIRAVIAKVYELLPMPVRLVLPRDFIINKILEQKGPLLNKVKEARLKRKK
ncbi:hypothetical protein A3K93_06465 [Acinetobacter sp. NCu2D-2]|uniref:hypothetical protein n=1 Tax=Acinetobacter sp. NCu2D-2 TaxID=1608473 RepID=UPI0007CDBAD4|nr:hypothetical protein [Acinetobacter sp. NCu2D-2]ANF81869.1 hypothetical protein A3K93_06465 [Acinetobacter sp. NCu2D-2]